MLIYELYRLSAGQCFLPDYARYRCLKATNIIAAHMKSTPLKYACTTILFIMSDSVNEHLSHITVVKKNAVNGVHKHY